MDANAYVPFLLLAAAIAPIVIAVRVLRRRNRQAPAARAHWAIYAALIVAQGLIVWCAAAALLAVTAQFMASGGLNLAAAVQPVTPWPFTTSHDEATWPVVFSVSQIDVTFAGLDVWTKLMLGAGFVLLQVAPATIAVATSIVCSSVVRGEPFTTGLDRVAWIGASTMLVSGFGGQLLVGLGTVRATQTAIAWLEKSGATDLPIPTFPTIELWPLYGALGLAVFAVLARYGTGYRRDVEGLV